MPEPEAIPVGAVLTICGSVVSHASWGTRAMYSQRESVGEGAFAMPMTVTQDAASPQGVQDPGIQHEPPSFGRTPDTRGTNNVLTREDLTMSNALQPWRGQDTTTRVPPGAVLGASTRTPPPLPNDTYPAPAQLSADAIMLLDTYGRVKVYQKNTVLIPPGVPSPACYVVRSGRVRVYVSAPNGKELTLSLPGLGEPVGDLGLLEEAPYVGTAVTLTPATLLVVPRTSFGACLAAHPDFALEFLRLAAQRIAHLTSLVQRLAFDDVQSRIMALLAALAQDQEGARVVEQQLTHQEIADMIGATRETVCRGMKELYGSGCLALDNGRLRVVAHTSHPPGTRPATVASSQEALRR
jgi:CRP/FNR family transcriptional regulator, cyclic AMP receptor protein